MLTSFFTGVAANMCSIKNIDCFQKCDIIEIHPQLLEENF